jgi:hypothetical protein
MTSSTFTFAFTYAYRYFIGGGRVRVGGALS